jgi:hypothetical protein
MVEDDSKVDDSNKVPAVTPKRSSKKRTAATFSAFCKRTGKSFQEARELWDSLPLKTRRKRQCTSTAEEEDERNEASGKLSVTKRQKAVSAGLVDKAVRPFAAFVRAEHLTFREAGYPVHILPCFFHMFEVGNYSIIYHFFLCHFHENVSNKVRFWLS